MEIKSLGKIGEGQDGAIFGGIIFRFDHLGNGAAFRLAEAKEGRALSPFATFRLDKSDILAPHSNAVFFGTQYYEEGDEFPLLYSNIYNNYSGAEDPLIGVCLAYRLVREGEGFQTTLVQMLEIGFKENAALWKAYPEKHGVRPYGNFVIDKKTNALYAFVMRDEACGTRYFKFRIPSATEGKIDLTYGVRRFVFSEADILDSFDTPHHHYIQGGIAHEGRIYSTEGFEGDVERPAIRIIDVEKRAQIAHFDLFAMGYDKEPEMIDFADGKCYYSDAYGNFYTVSF